MRYLILLILLLKPASGMSKGGVTSSGGDSIAAEFTLTARHIADILESETGIGIPKAAFLDAVNSTSIVSRERVKLDGHEREAINSPARKRIIVNRRRWLETANQIGRRYMLVMHEYLSIMGIDDSKYQVSSKLFKANGKKRIEIICSPFNDLAIYGGDAYRLHYILFEDREVTIVKTSAGKIPEFPLGQTLASAVPLPGANSAILIVVNFGILRNIQIPYSFLAPSVGKFEGKMWDTHAAGERGAVRAVQCEASAW